MKAFLLLVLLSARLLAFDYDMHVNVLPGTGEKTTLCMHGMGGDYRIAETLQSASTITDTLVSFNFPDHNKIVGRCDAAQTHFGTIQELLPALSLLKTLIIDEKRSSLNLYGYSAGGGAIINILATLNTDKHDKALKTIGIQKSEKKQILAALEQGLIILDTPLKSLAEIIDARGAQPDLITIGKRYKQNGMEPIEAISHLKNLSLNFLVHFQSPDEVLSNRDDLLFFERLKAVNRLGKTDGIIGTDKGHMLPHPTLWRYLNLAKE